MLKAFYDGCPVEKKLVKDFEYEASDVAVIFGVYKSKVRRSWPRGKVFRQQREKKLDVVVLETGYVNRGDGEDCYFAAGFNGLNGRADFRNKNMGPERAQKLADRFPGKMFIQPWPYESGEHIVLCGQVPHDASVDHTDHKQWISETAQKLKAMTSRKIVFRPHPLFPLPAIHGCELSTKPLAHDLARAHAVVTFNSNSGVEAAIFGKPVFAFDEGSMVWSIANKDLRDINEPQHPNRKQWWSDLAYTQWTPEEMRHGKAWAHLFR